MYIIYILSIRYIITYRFYNIFVYKFIIDIIENKCLTIHRIENNNIVHNIKYK